MPPAPVDCRLPLHTSSSSLSSLVHERDYSPMQSRPKSLAFTGGSLSSNLFGGRSPDDNERRSPPLGFEDDGTPSERRRSPVNASRYKTELCRPFMENGVCKYGEKCQFAHGNHEVRAMARHPKYKTEYCRTFHSQGFCPYGPRCHFIHDPSEKRDRCTPTTPRSFSMSSPITPSFPLPPGRSPSPPSSRASDEQFPSRRSVHKPIQRQFSSPAAMGRPPTNSSDDEVFQRSPPSSPNYNGGRFSMSSLQDAIDSVVESPRLPASKSSTAFPIPPTGKAGTYVSQAEMGSPGGRRLPVFNTLSRTD